jgi:hypothetical protein
VPGAAICGRSSTTTTGCTGTTWRVSGDPPLARRRAWADSLPENRLHGVVAGKLYTYASDARIRRWPNGIEITGKEHQHDQHISQRRTRADGIREAHRRPRQRDHRRRTRHSRLDRDDLESVLRLIWPSMAELHACFHLSQRRQAARDDAAFNELIARRDEEDDEFDG